METSDHSDFQFHDRSMIYSFLVTHQHFDHPSSIINKYQIKMFQLRSNLKQTNFSSFFLKNRQLSSLLLKCPLFETSSFTMAVAIQVWRSKRVVDKFPTCPHPKSRPFSFHFQIKGNTLLSSAADTLKRTFFWDACTTSGKWWNATQ